VGTPAANKKINKIKKKVLLCVAFFLLATQNKKKCYADPLKIGVIRDF
jgi:hypothetical protein